jgi:DNA-binding transcriptional MerR regulator
VLGDEPDRHNVLFVSVTAPDVSPDSRLEAVELELKKDDGVGYIDAGRMAEALVTTSRVVTQERHQVDWGATGLVTLTTVVSYLELVAAGLTIEGIKAAIEHWPKRKPDTVTATVSGGDDHREAEVRNSILQFLRRAFRDEVFDDVSFQRDRQGGWDFVASSGSARYEGRVHPGGHIRTARRHAHPADLDSQNGR